VGAQPARTPLALPLAAGNGNWSGFLALRADCRKWERLKLRGEDQRERLAVDGPAGRGCFDWSRLRRRQRGSSASKDGDGTGLGLARCGLICIALAFTVSACADPGSNHTEAAFSTPAVYRLSPGREASDPLAGVAANLSKAVSAKRRNLTFLIDLTVWSRSAEIPASSA
jgi:hypothetical protein